MGAIEFGLDSIFRPTGFRSSPPYSTSYMGFHSSPLLASMPTDPDLVDTVGYLLTGFCIVMLTLLALALVCSAIGALFRAFPKLATAGMPSPEKKSVSNRSSSGVDEKVVAVIGAAVDQALGGRYRIKSIAPLGKKP